RDPDRASQLRRLGEPREGKRDGHLAQRRLAHAVAVSARAAAGHRHRPDRGGAGLAQRQCRRVHPVGEALGGEGTTATAVIARWRPGTIVRVIRPSLLLSFFVAALGAPAAHAADPLPRARPEALGLDPARLARIRQVLERDVAQGRMPGAVVAIARRGKLAYFEAIGFLDREKKTPMPKDAIFSIASMTKPLTAVAAMILQEEGKIHLAEPAARYLPPLANLRVAVDPD